MPKRKPGTGPKAQIVPRERYASGRVKAETAGSAVEPLAPTLIHRLKTSVLPTLKDKRLGTVLGLMHFEGVLTEAEVEAGFRYADDVGAYERVMGHPARHARSASYEGGFKGAMAVDLEALKRMDPEAAEKIERKIKRGNKKIRQRYDRAQACIPSLPIIASTIVEEVCCNDRRVNPLYHDGLRQILRNLALHYGIVAETRQRPKAGTSKKADAALLAQGAVDAMLAWFERRRSTITGYRVSVENRVQAPSITVYGHTKDGEVVENTIHIKRSGLMTAELNAQLMAKAAEQGWPRAGMSAGADRQMTDDELKAAIDKLRPNKEVA